jgi:8-amino-7-oxononanoate synthase
MLSLNRFATEKLATLDATHLRRHLIESARDDGVWITRNGRRLLSFCCNDYLNLTQHPAVIEAAIQATGRWGVGAGASRLVTGNHPLFAELEGRLARLKGTEDCCVFGSGTLANTGIIPTLIGPADLILIDELAHACLWAGARLSGARTLAFRHNNLAHLADLLTTHRAAFPKTLIATDGVFSMDGDLAPLHAIGALAAAHDAWLLSDDAHGIGVLAGGRGSAHVGGPAPVPLQMGTLSKAIGGYGGYLCAARPVIELMRNRARSFVYSTGLPPACVAAAIAALDLIEADPAWAATPLAHARLFTTLTGLPEATSPIVPLLLGDAPAALAAAAALDAAGFLVTAIRPPTVPDGTARLRFTFTAAHRPADIERLAALVRPLKRPPNDPN